MLTELCKSKVENVRQGFENVQIYSQHFRSIYNELTYALQSEHSSEKERKITLKMEENTAAKQYVMNLSDEISSQVTPMKPENLNEAFQEALEAEIWIKEKNKITKAITSEPIS